MKGHVRSRKEPKWKCNWTFYRTELNRINCLKKVLIPEWREIMLTDWRLPFAECGYFYYFEFHFLACGVYCCTMREWWVLRPERHLGRIPAFPWESYVILRGVNPREQVKVSDSRCECGNRLRSACRELINLRSLEDRPTNARTHTCSRTLTHKSTHVWMYSLYTYVHAWIWNY